MEITLSNTWITLKCTPGLEWSVWSMEFHVSRSSQELNTKNQAHESYRERRIPKVKLLKQARACALCTCALCSLSASGTAQWTTFNSQTLWMKRKDRSRRGALRDSSTCSLLGRLCSQPKLTYPVVSGLDFVIQTTVQHGAGVGNAQRF